MKVSFIRPIKINKKPAKTFTWSDGCPMGLKSINPIYRIARNHYQDLYELYKKLYQIGYVCTDQTAVTQVHRYPAASVVFRDLNFHIFQPTFWWYTCDDINSKNVVDDHRKYWKKTNRSLDAAAHILKQFSKKFDKYGRKITVNDKLNQAIKNAKKAERSAKRAEELVQQYKNHGKNHEYLIVLAYDNTATQNVGNKLFTIEQTDRYGGIREVSPRSLINDYIDDEASQIYWFSSYKKACQRVSLLRITALNTPHILSYSDFRDITNKIQFCL